MVAAAGAALALAASAANSSSCCVQLWHVTPPLGPDLAQRIEDPEPPPPGKFQPGPTIHGTGVLPVPQLVRRRRHGAVEGLAPNALADKRLADRPGGLAAAVQGDGSGLGKGLVVDETQPLHVVDQGVDPGRNIGVSLVQGR